MIADRYCTFCRHLFYSRHIENDRCMATDDEVRVRRCRDCVDCHPPEDATVQEQAREEVPA